MKNIIFALLITSTTTCLAQFHKTYDWNGNPKLHQLTEEEMQESSIAILEKYIVEYRLSEFGIPMTFETKHTITKVIDDAGIGRHNTVYIPMYQVSNVIDIKARTINPDGNVVVLNKDNIKEVKNVEEYGDFKIFAIEGVEKTGEIEVLYTVQKEFDIHGTETIQTNYKIKEAQFLFITGDFDSRIKAYRTTSEFKPYNLDGNVGKAIILKDVPAMIEEEYATPNANKIAVVYQCFKKGQSISNDSFWKNVIENVGYRFFPEMISNEIKNDLTKLFPEDKEQSTYEKIALLDDYIKNNFTVVQNNNEELSDIEYIIKNRMASQLGILKTYSHYLTALGVDFEIVLTANRYNLKFDPVFFTPNMLRDFLIYVPSEKKYLSPDRIEYRFGEAPFNILGNNGVFMNKNLEYYFSEIIQEDQDYSRIVRETNITFDENMEYAQIQLDQDYYGHWAVTNRAVLALSSEQNIKDFQDYLTSSGIEDKIIKDYEAENTEMLQLKYNQPFTTRSTITSESLLEEAGDSFIFLIGNVIGTQSELYQETKRLNPIEMQYPNQYDYNITIHIPDGYEAEGLDALIIDKSYKSSSGEKLCKFESGYKTEGNKLIITIQEFYKTNIYDIERYDEFRTVINAASDFNKASILLKSIE